MDQLNNSVIREAAAGDVNMRETQGGAGASLGGVRGCAARGPWWGEGVARDVTPPPASVGQHPALGAVVATRRFFLLPKVR